MVKNLPVIAGDERDMRLIPGSGRLPGGGHATPSIILAWRIGAKHWWVSGRILACHVGGPGLISSQCKSTTIWASQVGLVVKNPPAIAGGIKRQKFDPWVRKIPWRRKWKPTRYSCLESSMDRGAWQATVHGVTKSQTRLSDTHTHVYSYGGASIQSTCEVPTKYKGTTRV